MLEGCWGNSILNMYPFLQEHFLDTFMSQALCW